MAAALTIGVHGTSVAGPMGPATELRLQPAGTIVVADGENLSNQPRNGDDDEDTNGNNGSE